MAVSRREFLQASAAVIVGAEMGMDAEGAVRPEGRTLQGSSGSAIQASSGSATQTSGGTWPGAVKALVFDTFGTVVDWRSSVAREVDAVAKRKGVTLDAEKFADAWRAGYGPSMNKVRTGELPWTRLDALHRMILDKILVDYKLAGLSEDEKDALNRAWHRLTPWPDAVAGLTRLKKKFVVAPLSNGNISLMTHLAKFGGLPWDAILGAELARHYKPDREVYQSAADVLDLQPAEVMMVAAHLGDLRAAKAVGLRTAFVTRPKEFGPNGKPDVKADASVDLSAVDFNDLARQLGA